MSIPPNHSQELIVVSSEVIALLPSSRGALTDEPLCTFYELLSAETYIVIGMVSFGCSYSMSWTTAAVAPMLMVHLASQRAGPHPQHTRSYEGSTASRPTPSAAAGRLLSWDPVALAGAPAERVSSSQSQDSCQRLQILALGRAREVLACQGVGAIIVLFPCLGWEP